MEWSKGDRDCILGVGGADVPSVRDKSGRGKGNMSSAKEAIWVRGFK